MHSMNIQLSDHFTYPKLLRWVLPSVLTMIITSVYSMVDGLFISNFVGKLPFAAINLVYPFFMILGSLGFMMGTGGSAIVGRLLGQQNPQDANRSFSLFACFTVGVGVILSALAQLLLPYIVRLLGAKGSLVGDCILYSRILLLAMPFFMLQFYFQMLFITAERAKLGTLLTVTAGCTNILLDALFVVVFQWGLAGAAAATAISQSLGGLFPVFYFSRPNRSRLRFTTPARSVRLILHACANGSSELMSNIAASIVTILYNLQLLRLAGEDGVAAYGVVMYVAFIFSAIFLGYAIGSAPLFSYHYGAESHGELKNLLGKSLRLLPITGACMLLIASLLSPTLAKIFVGYDPQLCAFTAHALRIYSFAFLFSGLNIFGSAFFTALSNGPVSAAISFLRTLVFEVGSVLLLPLVLDVDGIWLSITVAETAALAVTTRFLLWGRKKYHYA